MKLNWLLVGTGDIASKRVGPALSGDERSQLYAVCDQDTQAAGVFAGRFDVGVVYESFEEAIQDRGVDAVYIATPIFLHKEMTMKALDAGKHVLVEKPMALTASDASEMNRQAARAGKKLGVSYFRRYFEKYRYIQDMLENNEFGSIVLVRMAYFSWYNPDKEDPKYWRVIPEKSGGGPISDMGTHMFDLLVGLFDLPQSVYARVETNIHGYGVEDAAVLLMKLKNGAQCTASFHWCSKTWSHEFEIVGTEAKVKWHPFDGPVFVKTVGRNIQEITMPPAENVHAPLISDFNRWILDGGAFDCTGEEAGKTNALIDALYQSSLQGKEVTL